MWQEQKMRIPDHWQEDRADLQKLADKAMNEGTISVDAYTHLLNSADGVTI